MGKSCWCDFHVWHDVGLWGLEEEVGEELNGGEEAGEGRNDEGGNAHGLRQ